MNIFVSHSSKDKNFIERIRDLIRKHGFTPLIAEDEISLSETINQKVERLIGNSELAVVALTRNGSSASFVQQEIGYLQKAQKPMLVLVEKGLEHEVEGFLYGRDYLTMDPNDLDAAFSTTEQKIISFGYIWEKRRQVSLFVLLVLAIVIAWGLLRSS